MKVILLQTVPKVGKEGTIATVKDGYARNYLFPRKMAILADKTQVKALEARNARLAAKLAETKASAVSLKDKLEGQTLTLEGKVGADQTRLFGAITAQDIADAIKSNLGVTLEKKQVGILEPIKRLGSYKIALDLHREVDAHITVNVIDPNAVVVEAPAEEAPAAAEEATEELVEA